MGRRMITRYKKLVLLIAFLSSLSWILMVNTQPFSDFKYYHELAMDIARGGQWGDTYTSVGYSIVLGFLYKIFGANLWVAKVLNLALNLINNVLVLKILGKSQMPDLDRKLIFTLFAFFPSNIFYTGIAGTEILFTTGLLLITLLYMSELKHKYPIIGLLTGLNTMIKPFFPLFFLVVLVTESMNGKKLMTSIRNSIVVLLVCLATISPWLYRNYQLIGQFTYVSNNGGIVLYINNNSQNKTGGWMPAAEVENSLINTPEYIQANHTEQNKMLSAAAQLWIRTHPVQFVQLGFKRLVRTYIWVGGDLGYSLYGSGLNQNGQKILYRVTEGYSRLIFISGLLALLISILKIIKGKWKKEEPSRFATYLVILFLMFALVFFLTEGQPRYSFPTIFNIIYFSYNGAKALFRKIYRNSLFQMS